MTAVDAFLISLYGFRPDGDPPAEKQQSCETASSLSNPLQTDVTLTDNGENRERDEGLTNHSGGPLKDHGAVIRTDASLDHQISNNSSSSSVAEDWVVNQIPAGFECNFSLRDDHSCTQMAEAEQPSRSPKRLDNGGVSSNTTRELLSAEDWSRGTALMDPVSGEPLQPVRIHQPLKTNNSVSDQGPSSSSKKILNAITEKPAALTAYDLISNRAMRAPPSPAALFEKEARAEVLREKPTASLQDISAAVDERWKNLREEDRKK